MELIVLDRDGVVNEDSEHFIKSPDEWVPIPGSLEAICALNRAGKRVVIASNQSGLARGLFSRHALDAIHRKMLCHLEKRGGYLDGIFFCPHGPDDGCDCRKPKPGLLIQASEALAVHPPEMIVVGDSLRDLEAARRFGAASMLVLTGNGEQTLKKLPGDRNIPVFGNLASAVDHLLVNRGKLESP